MNALPSEVAGPGSPNTLNSYKTWQTSALLHLFRSNVGLNGLISRPLQDETHTGRGFKDKTDISNKNSMHTLQNHKFFLKSFKNCQKIIFVSAKLF